MFPRFPFRTWMCVLPWMSVKRRTKKWKKEDEYEACSSTMKKEHGSSAGVRDGVRRKNHVILQEEKYASGTVGEIPIETPSSLCEGDGVFRLKWALI